MRRCILASGVFDPFHPGHVAYLQAAKALAETEQRRLAVAVAPDHLAKHPVILPASQRAALVAPFADDVTIGTASQAIQRFRPAVYVKGNDWKDRLPPLDQAACHGVGCEWRFVDSGHALHSSSLLTAWRQSADDLALRDLEYRYTCQPLPTADTFDDAYFASQGYTLEKRRKIEGRWPQLIMDLFEPKSVLDYGCGPGIMMALLQEQRPHATIHGLDIGKRDGLNMHYDLVICREVLEHVPFRDWLSTLRDICRFAQGYVFLTTRFSQQPFSAFTTDPGDHLDPTHISLITPEYLRSLLVLSGFARCHDKESALDGKGDGRILVYRRV